MTPSRSSRARSALLLGSAVLGGGLLVLPAPSPEVEASGSTAFRWDADALFAALEAEFNRAAAASVEDARDEVGALEEEGDALLRAISASQDTPDEALGRLATLQFELAVRGAAHAPLLDRVQAFLVRARVQVMKAAALWTMSRRTHDALYRVVFGGRIALDEALIQAGTRTLSPIVPIEEVPSEAPSIVVEGVRIHSGDILLSRGGAPTSALIARGNDFPNTFSHAALAHVDPETGEAMVVEALIETGSVLSTVDEYLESKKHRILVLRLRPDHPALAADPLVAHRASESMLARVRRRHIPYDFAMEWDDPSSAFCSEIVYHAYREEGVDLWTLRGSMSAPGLVRWLAGLGVREFTSLVPSDLEYDPQVRAVVEWRDAPALMDFRLDNAVIDALLEEAERGSSLGYAWYALPSARVIKAYSVVEQMFGAVPTIPDGMSSATALRVDALVSTIHPTIKEELARKAADFRASNGYEAPYWTLVELARGALEELRTSLEPALMRP
jgi:hypothetical protein